MSDLQSVLNLKVRDIAYIPALGIKARNWILILTRGSEGMDFIRFATKSDAIKMRNIVFNMTNRRI